MRVFFFARKLNVILFAKWESKTKRQPAHKKRLQSRWRKIKKKTIDPNGGPKQAWGGGDPSCIITLMSLIDHVLVSIFTLFKLCVNIG